jgi:very-short-patch-repair endonuclease
VRWDVAAVVGERGWATRSELTARVDRGTVDAWVTAGRLVRLQPGVYALPVAAQDWRTRVEAVARSRHAVVSHRTALALWGLVPVLDGPVHLTVATARSARGSAGVVLHRAPDVDEVTRRVEGVRVTCVERALVDSWAEDPALVRAAAITAVRERLCTAAHLQYELARRPRLPGRRRFTELVRLLADGCRSELEIWGCLHVLRGPGMPAFVQQREVVVRGERFVLDAAYEDVLLAVEMDGAAWHGSRRQREADIRRDALLATIGWQTLRFGYARATADPTGCQHDLRAVHAARRGLFGVR